MNHTTIHISEGLDNDYGFYCELEQEDPYIYEVVWHKNAYRVIRRLRKQPYQEPIPKDKPGVSFEKNMIILIVFIISSAYLIWI